MSDTQEKARPRVVCLCGSTRFEREFIAAARRETLAGRIVLSVGLFGHGEGLDMAFVGPAMLDELHLRKIDLADEALVLDAATFVCSACGKYAPVSSKFLDSSCCHADIAQRPYVGDSTRREIAYAEAHGKPVRYLSKEGQP